MLRIAPIVAALVLLLAVGGVIAWLALSSQAQSRLVFHAFQTQGAATRVLRLAQSAETGQRGYLITGEDRYLAPYEAAKREIEQAVRTLLELAGDDPRLSGLAQETRAAVDEKMAELARTVELNRKGDVAGAVAVVRTDVGRELMNRIRIAVDQILAAEGRVIDLEYRQGQTLDNALLTASLAAIVIVILAGGAAVVAFQRYLALVKASEAATARLNETLEAAVAERTAELSESNEEIQRFAYIVSHDLRAPLVNVMGFTSELEALKDDLLAAGDPAAPPAQRAQVVTDFDESIRFIKAAIDKMEGLIAAILRLSREGRRTFRHEPVALGDLMNELASAQRHQCEAVGAVVVVAPSLPTVVGDRVALGQIFGNLLDNAIKYLDPARPGRIEVSGETIGARVRISVRDNGRGIAAHDHKRVFELFRRSGAQDKPGEGIGLAYVQTLARSMGGRVTLSSELGQGSVFTVVLPLAPKGWDAAAADGSRAGG